MFFLISAAGVCPAAPAPSDPSRQLLVMLHLPAAHYRPGESYGGGYGERRGARAHAVARRHELARDFGLMLVSDWPMPDLGVDCYVMQVPAGRAASDVVQAMSKDKRAEWVQPMNTFHALERADSLHALQPAAATTQAPRRIEQGEWRASGIRVAIVDSGVDATHPDLAGRVADRREFRSMQIAICRRVPRHRRSRAIASAPAPTTEHVSMGIVPARRAMTGVARLLGGVGQRRRSCSSFSLAWALQFAIRNNAQVINLSLAGPDDKLLARLIDVATRARQHRSSSAFSTARTTDGGGFPHRMPGVLAVAEEVQSHPPDDSSEESCSRRATTCRA